MNTNGSMKVFYGAVIIVLISLVAISLSFKAEKTKFSGIADAREIVVNVQTAVEIKRIFVVPGQIVKAGDTLVEVNNVGINTQELDMKIVSITHEIEEYKARKSAQFNLSKSEVRQQKLELEDRKSEIMQELQDLQLQYNVNKTLMSDLKSISKDYSEATAASNNANPILQKIEFLKKELRRIDDSSNITIAYHKDERSVNADPIDEQIKQREAELKVMQEIKKDYHILAKIDGVIGVVDYKEGEKVNEFDTIITLHTMSPSFVRGYIHENTYSQVSIGQKVNVTSVDVKKIEIQGEVIGVGSRIVEYPVRLRKFPDLQMWGREVTIRIPEQNKFLLGEKVMVSTLEYTVFSGN